MVGQITAKLRLDYTWLGIALHLPFKSVLFCPYSVHYKAGQEEKKKKKVLVATVRKTL
jgi:hypothetical protein